MLDTSSFLANLLIQLPLWGAYAAGVLLSALLVGRRRDTPAWLLVIGFGLLLLVSIAWWVAGMLPIFMYPGTDPATIATIVGWLHLVLNLVSAAGVVCLAVAVWTGMQRPAERQDV